MCFLLYELAVNSDVQDQLAKEIREHNANNGGKFNFKSIQGMVYLDMVTSGETDLYRYFVLCLYNIL